MASLSTDKSHDLKVRSVSRLADGFYRLILEHQAQVYEFVVRPVEHSPGIRAVEDTEPLFHFLVDHGHLGVSKYIFRIIWQMADGLEPNFPVVLESSE